LRPTPSLASACEINSAHQVSFARASINMTGGNA